MDAFWAIVLGLAVIVVVIGLLISGSPAKRATARKAALTEHLDGLGFVTYVEVSEKKPFVLADREHGTLRFITIVERDKGEEPSDYTVTSEERSTTDLQQVELRIDKEVVTRTSSTSMAGRSLVGGTIAGKGGSAVGAMTAKQHSTERAMSYEVITMLSGGPPNVLRRTFERHEEDKARTLVAQITTLIKEADARRGTTATEDVPIETTVAIPAGPAPQPEPATEAARQTDGSVGAELERLVKLRDSGALTDAEFQTLKARVIGAE